MAQFRPVRHPDLFDSVTHLTGRPGAHFSESELDPRGRLASILEARTIVGSRPYGAPTPVVCFTESTPQGLEFLVGELGYEPWGIMFKKDFVWAKGAAPALYVRSDEYELLSSMPRTFRSRAVRLEPGQSEWLHEREWRCPCEHFTFVPDDVVALLVGTYCWEPPVPEMRFNYQDFDWAVEAVPAPWATGFPLWVWNEIEQCFYQHD